MVATTADVGATFEKNTFGLCQMQPLPGGGYKPCQAMVTQWSGAYENVTYEENNGHPLLEDSKATCPIGGKDCISIINHGQVAEITNRNLHSADPIKMDMINPFIDFREFTFTELAKKVKPVIQKIECTTLSTEEDKRIIIGKSYTFRISKYENDILPLEEEKKQIKWEIFFGEGSGITVIEHKGGEEFIFDTSECNIDDTEIIVYAFFEDKNKEAQLQISIKNDYAVVVGFEVNKPEAYAYRTFFVGSYIAQKMENMTLESDIDVGHTFFYITKNRKIKSFFSFGPKGKGLRRLYGDGNPNYKISENVKLFTIPLSQDEYNGLIEETEKMRESIIAAWAIKDTNYNLFINTTCTSIAKQVLNKVIPNKIPQKASCSILLKGFYLGDLINPYAWYDSFKSSQWAYTKKSVPANKNLWDQIMKSCEEGNFEIDEYSYKIE